MTAEWDRALQARLDREPPIIRRAIAAPATEEVSLPPDVDAVDRALSRILRACAESAERYGKLDAVERRAEVGRLREDVAREVERARRALGVA